MAERWAVASTAWSLLSTWNGGASLPASGDDVYANGFTVTIDQNVTANSLRIEAGTTAVQGGGFTVASGTYAIGLQALSVGAHTGASTGILTLAGGVVTLTVVGTILGDSSTAGTEPPAVLVTGGTHIVNANVLGGTAAGGTTIVVSGATANLTVNGTVTGSALGTSTYGVNVTGASARLTVVGGVVGGAAASSHGILMTFGFLVLDALLQWGSAGCAPVQSQVNPPMFKRSGSLLAMQAPSDDNLPAATGAAITVERYTTGNPLPANVRLGTTYGPGATSTGTLAVPPAASVASGVPVDASTGTAALKLSDVAAVTGDQIAAALA